MAYGRILYGYVLSTYERMGVNNAVVQQARTITKKSDYEQKIYTLYRMDDGKASDL